MADVKKYAPRTWANLKGLKGISDGQLADHFKLYEGYVKNTNLLTEKLWGLAKEGKASGTDPEFAELTRHLGFEYNGMILHEYYFDNLAPAGKPLPKGGKLAAALDQSFGSFDTFLADFKAVAGMRGIGWAVLYRDPVSGWLSTHWVTLHNDGNPAGYKPILVIDCWEHAFVPDYKPYERGKYVEAFLGNIDWECAEKRMA
jgi:Fe-Mn family superoxide dismutase